jgi:hypothetical protein
VFLDPYPLLAAACDDRTVRVRLGSPFFFKISRLFFPGAYN